MAAALVETKRLYDATFTRTLSVTLQHTSIPGTVLQSTGIRIYSTLSCNEKAAIVLMNLDFAIVNHISELLGRRGGQQMHIAETFVFESDDNDAKAWVRVINTRWAVIKKCLKTSTTRLRTCINNNSSDYVRCQDHMERSMARHSDST
jgi:hypothetical protein